MIMIPCGVKGRPTLEIQNRVRKIGLLTGEAPIVVGNHVKKITFFTRIDSQTRKYFGFRGLQSKLIEALLPL
jgi:hypothetical protein